MKAEKINAIVERVITPRWWNPASWVVTFFAPLMGIIGGTIAGAVLGLFMGFKMGLEQSTDNVDEILSRL